MQKQYSLDFSIERDIDRLAAVEQIIDTADYSFTNKELEQLASYILYGKDENGKNAMQRGECNDSDIKRYKNFKKMDDKISSLDEILDDPLSNELELIPMEEKYVYVKKKRSVARPRYDKQGNLIDIGDADVPGMKELWDAIDHIEHTIAANEGIIEFNEDDSPIRDAYRLWQLKHQLIDMRRHQYYLLESYKPTLHFNAPIINKTPTYNFDSDSFHWISRAEWDRRIKNNYYNHISSDIDDYERRINPNTGEEEIKWVVKRQNFNWENPWHVKNLMNYYSDIYMQDYDKLDSWGRTLIYDFDRYVTLCNFSQAREYIILRRIDKASLREIREELQVKFGLKYTEIQLASIVNREIPNKISEMAQKIRLLKETPEEDRKVCGHCGRALPLTTLFYSKNITKKYGVESSCKECQKKMRIARGIQSDVDRRRKDQKMFEVQTNKTNS